MKFLPFRWAFVLLFSLGLTLTGCGEEMTTEPGADAIDETETEDEMEAGAEDEMEPESEADTEDMADESDALELAPAADGTFAASIQEVLMTSFPEQTGFEVELVACPEEVTLESGEPFVCDVLVADGFVTPVDVVTDPETETFDWTTKGLDIKGLEEAIAAGMMENLALAGEVDCGLGDDPNPFREEEVGASFECEFIEEDGNDQTINVVVNDEDGNVTWNVN